MLKTLYVLNIGNYRPELLKYTLPTIKYWCSQNNWNYCEIKRNYFKDLPITANKLKIFDFGKHQEWAAQCDADLMLRPDLIDPTKKTSKNYVMSSYNFEASSRFKKDKYFERDGRNWGLSGGFIITSELNHELREYPKTKLEWKFALRSILTNPHIIDEYIVSRNLAKYGFQYTGICPEVDNFIVHFGSELVDNGVDKGAIEAKALFEKWSILWPKLKNY